MAAAYGLRIITVAKIPRSESGAPFVIAVTSALRTAGTQPEIADTGGGFAGIAGTSKRLTSGKINLKINVDYLWSVVIVVFVVVIAKQKGAGR